MIGKVWSQMNNKVSKGTEQTVRPETSEAPSVDLVVLSLQVQTQNGDIKLTRACLVVLS